MSYSDGIYYFLLLLILYSHLSPIIITLLSHYYPIIIALLLYIHYIILLHSFTHNFINIFPYYK